jgi:hypothetical protein
MSTPAFVLACFAGIAGFGCLVAGILLLRDYFDQGQNDSGSQGRLLVELLDYIFLFGLAATAYDTAKNWNSRRDARRFIYAGLIGLVITVAALCFG